MEAWYIKLTSLVDKIKLAENSAKPVVGRLATSSRKTDGSMSASWHENGVSK